MPEKQNSRDRKYTHTAFAAIAITMLLTLWNMFAGQDRSKAEIASTTASALERKFSEACHTPMPNQGTGTRCMTITRTRSS